MASDVDVIVRATLRADGVLNARTPDGTLRARALGQHDGLDRYALELEHGQNAQRVTIRWDGAPRQQALERGTLWLLDERAASPRHPAAVRVRVGGGSSVSRLGRSEATITVSDVKVSTEFVRHHDGADLYVIGIQGAQTGVRRQRAYRGGELILHDAPPGHVSLVPLDHEDVPASIRSLPTPR